MSDSSLVLPDSSDDEPSVAAAMAGPDTGASLVLQAPEPVGPVTTAAAADAVPISPADRERLDAMVAAYLDAVSTLDPHGSEFSDRVRDIGALGDDDIRASASVSSRLLQKSFGSLQDSRLAESSDVGRTLKSLRQEVEALDPSRQGDLFSPRKLLGRLPFGAGGRLRDYFDRYRSSQHQLDAIITALDHGRTELERDNSAIATEKVNLWAVMGRLRRYAYLAASLDTGLAGRIDAIAATDAERATALREDLLFSVRQKHQDLLTQLAVSVQGYLALDVIRRNNLELIKGVQRATTTTVSALRTAVIVAQAMNDQKLVLDQVTALNTTTSNLIESTAAMLRQQSGAINEQASAATVDIEKLQAAFANIYATMDEIDAFKTRALDTMQQTVTALTTEIERSATRVERVRSGEGQAGPLDQLGG